jgi:hypothetical protein
VNCGLILVELELELLFEDFFLVAVDQTSFKINDSLIENKTVW